ncbi:MAG: hypothetical protein WC975_11690 [Phycisphaerae bacterium]
MSSEFETCRQKLEDLAIYYKNNYGKRNEATTRLQLIDRLFFECLGWTKEDVILEESYERTYADYVFSAPRKILILEAKKEGDYFELPVGKEEIDYNLGSLVRDYPNLKKALEQVSSYCQQRGVPFGAVGNGHQVVAFIATRNDGLPPLEGRAVVFESFDVMLTKFLQLWKALSKPGIEKQFLKYRLVGSLLPVLPPKLSAKIPNYPGIKNRNISQTDLQIVSELVIEDITNVQEIESTFLDECYCQSGALSQHSLISKSILESRYASLFDSVSPGPSTVPAVMKGEVSPEMLSEAVSRRPILLIGDVGVGKTTFIRNLIKVSAKEIFDKSITLYIDLGSQATFSNDLKSFVPEEICRQLRDNYNIDIDEYNLIRGIYNVDIERFSKGLYHNLKESNLSLYQQKEVDFLEEKVGNREQHLKRALEHIVKGRKTQVIIFLDNSDQRDELIQQQTFLISQEIAQQWMATVFVSLRPETFHRSLQVGALSGYHPKAFTISPPRLDRVLDKRLKFALKLATGEIQIRSLSNRTKIHLKNLASIINVFLYSLEKNEDIIQFIDNISGGNIRMGLDMVKDFIGSGHVDTKEIIEKDDQNRQKGFGYVIPLHQFLRAVIYGDNEYYDPNRSPLVNLFDVNHDDPKEHFLLPVILALLAVMKTSGQDGGFVETSKLYDKLQGYGFTPEQIDWAILRGHHKKLLETSARRIPQIGQNMPVSLRVTTIGLYHIIILCNKFTYIDAVIVDTPVLDEISHSTIHDVQNIIDRLDRAEIFCSYLDTQWKTIPENITEFDWNSLSFNLKEEIRNIRNKAKSRGITSTSQLGLEF